MILDLNRQLARYHRLETENNMLPTSRLRLHKLTENSISGLIHKAIKARHKNVRKKM